MAQQYLPRNYGGSRYSNQSLGTPFVSAYDPNVVGRYAGLMQQEYGKAMAANQGMAARQAEIGDIMSLDPEGKAEVLGAYKDRVGKIREAYGNDLALAAPELARAVVEERENPWYAKNILYNKEFERRQKLLDQYGPNIQFMRDLPQGNLNQIEQQDIGFDYYNRQHLQQGFEQLYGDYAKRTTDLGMESIEGFPAFSRQRTRKGLTDVEVEGIASGEAQEFILESLEGMGLEPTPENIERLTDEFRSWGAASLIGGESVRVMPNPAVKTTSGGLPPNLFDESNMVKVDEEGSETPSRKETAKSGLDISDRAQRGELTYEEEQTLSEDPELLTKMQESPTYTAFSDSINGIPNITPEQQGAVISDLRAAALGTTIARDAIIEVLNKHGIINVRTQLTPQGTTGISSIDGKDVSKRQLNKFIEPLMEDFKKARSFNNSAEGRKLHKAVNAQVNQPVERGIYALTDESQGAMLDYFNDAILATSAENLASGGAYVVKRSGKDLNQKKTSNKIEDLQQIDSKSKVGRISYKESGSKGASPELIVATSEGELHLPLKGEQGEIHGMEMSVRSLDPKIINDVFRAYHDEALTKKGGSISIGEAFGDPDFKIPGLDKVYRDKRDGRLTYRAPVGDQELRAATPTELYQKIARYVNEVLPENYAMQVDNPTLHFLIRRYSDLLTASKKSEAVLGQIADIVQNQ